MNSVVTSHNSLAFVLHLVGAALSFALLVLLSIRYVFWPTDLFVPFSYIITALLRFAVVGFVFYGFSLVLLRVVPLPKSWAMIYPLVSWLLFTCSFYPWLPSGMMRRIADPEGYARMQQMRQLLAWAMPVAFGLVQAAYLVYALRQMSFASDTFR